MRMIIEITEQLRTTAVVDLPDDFYDRDDTEQYDLLDMEAACRNQVHDRTSEILERQVSIEGPYCTCPKYNPEDFDSPEDHAAACSTCPEHGTVTS